MKTVPHVVEDKYLRLFHADVKTIKKSKTLKKKKIVKKIVGKSKTIKKKAIKGPVKRKLNQSVSRRQRGNIKDILS